MTLGEKFPQARCAARGGCDQPVDRIETAHYPDRRTWSYAVCATHAMKGYEDYGRYVDPPTRTPLLGATRAAV